MLPPRLLPAISFLLALGCTAACAQSTLLSYWNLNNLETPYNAQTHSPGMWAGSAASFGEGYDATSHRLSSNSDGATAFTGEGVYIDFSSLPDENNTPEHRTWGTFTDTKINKAAGDDSKGASLLLTASVNGNHITFVLSSQGHGELQFSYASRMKAEASIQWSYSLDGVNFTPIAELKSTDAFQPAVLNLSGPDGLGLTMLNNQPKIFLRATLQMAASKADSISIDNIQFSGSSLP